MSKARQFKNAMSTLNSDWRGWYRARENHTEDKAAKPESGFPGHVSSTRILSQLLGKSDYH